MSTGKEESGKSDRREKKREKTRGEVKATHRVGRWEGRRSQENAAALSRQKSEREKDSTYDNSTKSTESPRDPKAEVGKQSLRDNSPKISEAIGSPNDLRGIGVGVEHQKTTAFRVEQLKGPAEKSVPESPKEREERHRFCVEFAREKVLQRYPESAPGVPPGEMRYADPEDPLLKGNLGMTHMITRDAWVADNGDTMVTAIHEQLHQVSDSDLGNRMQEGATEYLARPLAIEFTPESQKAYRDEHQIFEKMYHVVGDKPIRRAYFERDTEALRSSLDRAMGAGTFDRVKEAVEAGDFQTANDLFREHIEKRTRN